MVVIEIREVITEISEVVAHANAEILVDVAVQPHQETTACAAVFHVQPAVFGQAVPLGAQ